MLGFLSYCLGGDIEPEFKTYSFQLVGIKYGPLEHIIIHFGLCPREPETLLNPYSHQNHAKKVESLFSMACMHYAAAGLLY